MQWEGHYHPVSVGKQTWSTKSLGKKTGSLSERKYLVSNLMGCHRSRFGLRLNNMRVGGQQMRKEGIWKNELQNKIFLILEFYVRKVIKIEHTIAGQMYLTKWECGGECSQIPMVCACTAASAQEETCPFQMYTR